MVRHPGTRAEGTERRVRTSARQTAGLDVRILRCRRFAPLRTIVRFCEDAKAKNRGFAAEKKPRARSKTGCRHRGRNRHRYRGRNRYRNRNRYRKRVKKLAREARRLACFPPRIPTGARAGAGGSWERRSVERSTPDTIHGSHRTSHVKENAHVSWLHGSIEESEGVRVCVRMQVGLTLRAHKARRRPVKAVRSMPALEPQL
jgi:hypothetical protein